MDAPRSSACTLGMEYRLVAAPLPPCAVLIDRHVVKNAGTTLQSITFENDLRDGWAYWGYGLNNLRRVAYELQRAINRSSRCEDWEHRPPLRILGSLHYGSRHGIRDMFDSFGPASPLRQVMLQCTCKVVLMTRVREPTAWYRSFWSWSGVKRRQVRNSSVHGSTMIEFAQTYSNLQSLLLLWHTNIVVTAQYVGARVNTRANLRRYRCFEPPGYRYTPKTAEDRVLQRCGPGLSKRVDTLRQALRTFHLVGLVERFDETLLLLADMLGLQHILRSAARNLSPRGAYGNASLLGCAEDCHAQIAAAAPVDALMYSEMNASFAARVEAQGDAFATRVRMLREARAATPIPKLRGIRMSAKQDEKRMGVMSPKQCRGLLAGEEGSSAERVCRLVTADNQFSFAWRTERG